MNPAQHNFSNRGQLRLALVLFNIASLFYISPPPMLAVGNGASQAPPRLNHKIRVSDSKVADQISARGTILVADYGSFRIFNVDARTFAEFITTPGVEDATEQNGINLNTGAIDTISPAALALRQPVIAKQGKQLHLLQFAGPIKPEWYEALQQTGVQIVTYIPQNAYLLYGDSAALSQMQAWAASASFVQWEGTFQDSYKIHPAAQAANTKEEFQKLTTDTFAIQLVADGAANPATLQLIETLKLEPIRQQAYVLGYLDVVVRLPADRLTDIAAQPDVISIQAYPEPRKMDERQDQIMAGNLTGSVPTAPGYLAWLASKGFTQAQFNTSGFAVDLSDSGIDNGTTTPGHFGLYTSGDSTLASRVIYNRLIGTPNTGSTLQGCDGHGTLNSHIIAGFNDQPNGFPHTDSIGFHYGLGMCPFIKVGSSVIFDPSSFTSPSYENLQSQAYNDGARISSDSWGASTAGAYNTDSQRYDALVRDAQPAGSTFPTAGNQEMIIVFAAGNNGSGASTVGSPGTGKNVFTIGAAENVHSHSAANGGNTVAGTDGCVIDDSGADSANDIISFSSRGPCSDGRKKPDIMGPGTHVTGGVGQTSPPPPPTGTGSAISCFAAEGVCALPGGGTAGSLSNFFPINQQFFTTSSGTSHSTPATAGACALLRQYFINQTLPVPSPAMTKAYLMNAARYMTGVGANDTLPSNNQGMGEANLGLAFDGVARVLRDEVPVDKFTASGQSRTFVGTVVDPSKPFRVTLAWTDAPGNTSGNAYNNDLNLTVTVGGSTYLGNVFSGANSVTGGSADTRDNVESVFVPAGATGNFVVTVTAANINSDGVPNEAPALDQDFALVAYNANQTPVPVIAPDTAAIAAESCVPTNNAVDPGETVTVYFALKNVGSSNTFNVSATLLATNGVASPSAPQNYGPLTVGGSAVAMPFTFNVSASCGGTINPTLHVQDGGLDLGTVSFFLQIGQPVTPISENFDGISAPSLPPGWTTTASGAQVTWVTSTANSDTAPNAAYSPDATATGVNELVSPVFSAPPLDSQLSFRHNFALESGYDGGVLEISINGATFTDILTAGGSFVTGGYTRALNSSANPLTGRQAWTGTSGSFVTTTVNLPSSANGLPVQFKWRCGSDASLGLSGWYIDSISVTSRLCCGGTIVLANGFSLIAETCPNGAVDPGEMVTVNLGLRNAGPSNTTNLIGTLLPGGGVSSVGPPQTYGALASGGGTATMPFTFIATGACGGTNTATLQLQDGSNGMGTVTFSFSLGGIATNFNQNFDGVGAPALPAGWTTANSGAQLPWVTSTTLRDSIPNAAFSTDASSAGVNELVSPVINLPSGTSTLNFRNNYNTETGYDGGVLEIKIGAGAFTDIITAGGTFTANGYNRAINSGTANPLTGRQGWSGNSGGFVTTSVNLPSAAAGQPVQLKWRCGSDGSVGSVGWYIDTISLTGPSCCITPSVLLLPHIETNGHMVFTLSGPAGFNYEIDSSSDFTSWGAVGTISNASGQVLFTDPSLPTGPFKAFRAKRLP